MAAPKTEAPAAPAAKGDPAATAPAEAASAAPGRSPLSAWLPVIAAIVLAPAVTWVAVEFVVLPRLQKKLAAPPAAEAAAATAAPAEGEEGKEGHGGKEGAAPGYEFNSIVVNLSGTMGTRYLKTTFLVTGGDDGVKALFEGNRAQMVDVTLNVLSSLSLTDLEEAGAKNIIREKLIQAYNQAFGRKVAEQVFFSDFVVQ